MANGIRFTDAICNTCGWLNCICEDEMTQATNPSRCPTCGSDDRKLRRKSWDLSETCGDSWHQCTRCGSYNPNQILDGCGHWRVAHPWHNAAQPCEIYEGTRDDWMARCFGAEGLLRDALGALRAWEDGEPEARYRGKVVLDTVGSRIGLSRPEQPKGEQEPIDNTKLCKRIFLQCLRKYPMLRPFNDMQIAPIVDAMEAYAATQPSPSEELIALVREVEETMLAIVATTERDDDDIEIQLEEISGLAQGLLRSARKQLGKG